MPVAAPIGQKDRRCHRRVVSRQRLSCDLHRVTEKGAWQAMIRNVSSQGIGLSLNRPVKVGMLLTLELPAQGGQASATRLLRVARVEAQPGGQWWFVGGTFLKKLTQLELDALRVKSPVIVPQSERRTNCRHTTRVKTPCPLVRIIEEGPWTATVRNISPRGLGLIGKRPFKPGTVVTVTLPDRTGRMGKPRLLRITHVKRQPDSPWWTFGGAFLTRLTPDEYDSLFAV